MLQTAKITKLHGFWEAESFQSFEKWDQNLLKKLNSLSHTSLKEMTEVLLCEPGDEFIRVRRQLQSLLEAWECVLEIKRHWNSTPESVDKIVSLHPGLVAVMYVGLKGHYTGDPTLSEGRTSFNMGRDKIIACSRRNRFQTFFTIGTHALRRHEISKDDSSFSQPDPFSNAISTALTPPPQFRFPEVVACTSFSKPPGQTSSIGPDDPSNSHGDCIGIRKKKAKRAKDPWKEFVKTTRRISFVPVSDSESDSSENDTGGVGSD